MSRGPWPKKTLDLAEEIALRRGAVYRCTRYRYSPFDLIIFEDWRDVYVKVRNNDRPVFHPVEVLDMFRDDLTRLHRMPLTRVTAREFWLRLQYRRWQHFLLCADSLVEIQANGMYIPRMRLPIPVEDIHSPDPGREDPTEDRSKEED